ncbi:response regulator [Flavobacterium turcicum]|uniref:Response regulator n=1 Tax=Flavobacterium turcicum TaxID=2764718 RepID=A0ABR7JHS2_9FLAO|nr:response regulator [Flavobacterium turcicum]MBC5864048.1 response regulator [Flavobacterium turcicum]NHL02814.1 response regulator [Flavobacterium turcicum]
MPKIDIACIIDDDPIFVFGTKRIMEIADFCESFMIFRNGKEAFDHLEAIILADKKLPDLILLDLNMPIWDGWKFLDEFTKIPSANPITIYIMTSSIDPADVEKAKSYDAVSNYLVKPITMEELQKLIL